MSETPPTKIQVQVLAHAGNVGGGPWHARGVGQGLRAIGLEPSLFWLGEPSITQDEIFDPIITCRPRSLPFLWRLSPLDKLPGWVREIRRHTADVDAVISLSPVLAYATRLARPHLPVIFAPASLDKGENPDEPLGLYQWFEKRSFKTCQRVLVPTSAVKKHIEALYCPLTQPIGCCPLGIDHNHVTQITQTRAELGIPNDAKVILTVGRIDKNKGQQHIARALARGPDSDWWWIVVGEGNEEEAVKAELRNSPMEMRTRFIGNVANPSNWYAVADVLVACSRNETFGLVIGEAMLSGTPVVIPKDNLGVTMSPLADFVEAYDLGYTFERNNVVDLMRALKQSLANDEARRTIGRRATSFAAKNFTWIEYAKCAVKLFNSTTNVPPTVIPPKQTPSPSPV